LFLSLLFFALLAFLGLVSGQLFIHLCERFLLNPLGDFDLKNVIRGVQHFADVFNTVICNVVVLQVVLGQFFICLHTEFNGLKHWLCVVELAVTNANLFKRFCTGESLKESDDSGVFNGVATNVELKQSARLVNADLK